MFTMISIFKYEKMVTQYACMQRDITYLESESILACIPVSHNIALLHALCLPILVKNTYDNPIIGKFLLADRHKRKV